MALPLPYTVYERPTYSVVPSNAVWRDPERAEIAAILRTNEKGATGGDLGSQVLRARGASASITSASHPPAPNNPWIGSACRWRTSNPSAPTSTTPPRWSACTTPRSRSSSSSSLPDATDALVYNHDVFDKHHMGDRTEDQDSNNPGVNANYANLVHNDLNDNSGCAGRELLTRNLRNFGRTQHYTEEEADRKMSRRFMSINLAKPIETVEQFPFVLCAWPSFADQPYINNYRIYDDRVGETTRFTYRPDHEWYWFPRQTPTEVSMLKCYDSVTDGSVSRWSFHTACIDLTVPVDAPCRKNVAVRSFVFF